MMDDDDFLSDPQSWLSTATWTGITPKPTDTTLAPAICPASTYAARPDIGCANMYF
jgi:hypothetical protein